MNFTGKVGQLFLADGVESAVRMSKNGGAGMTPLSAFYQESASRGSMMTASTGAAGVAPGTVLSVAPPLCIWNPPSSGRMLAITHLAMGFVSGTLGAGTLVAAAIPSQATVPTTGAELVPQSNLIGAPRGVGRAFQGSTVVAIPTIMRPLFTFGAFTTTSAVQPSDTELNVMGMFVIPPGAGFALQAIAAAGTSPLVVLSATWDEIPY